MPTEEGSDSLRSCLPVCLSVPAVCPLHEAEAEGCMLLTWLRHFLPAVCLDLGVQGWSRVSLTPGLPLPCVGQSALSAADSPAGFIWISPGCNLKVYYSLPSCFGGYIYLHFYWRILKYIHAYSIISWYKGTYLQNRKGLRFREWPYGCLYTLLHLKWITNKVLPDSTGNSAQCYVAGWREGNLGENAYMYLDGWVPL